MYHHVANCRRKALLKQAFSVFLIFTLYFNSFNSAYAANVGGWTIGGLVADGASSVVNASKTIVVNGANVVKTSTARITPTVGAVSKVLRGGAAGYALSIAVQQLLGAVDWVLDPANNRITYYPQTESCDNQGCIALPQVWRYNTPSSGARDAPTIVDACKIVGAFQTGAGSPWVYSRYVKNSTYAAVCFVKSPSKPTYSERQVPISLVGNPTYDPNAQPEPKSLPLDVVAAQVITNAETHPDSDKKAGSQVATTTAAQDLLDNDSATQSDVENQLNTNARTNTAEGANEATGETKPNVADPTKTDLKIGFPAFCGWAPTICEAAQATINFPQTVANWWSKAVLSFTEAYAFAKTKVQSLEDYFKEEPNATEEPPETINEIPLPELNTGTFQASAGCPPPIAVPIDFGTQGEIQISYEPICQMAEKWSFVAPLIGFLSGAMILVGVGRKGEDGEI
jgi:hypothetical protein